jgi:hypothetical protein
VERPPGGDNPYGLTNALFLLDVHMLDKGGIWGDRLRFLAQVRWLQPHFSDTTLTEISRTDDRRKADHLLGLMGANVISLGPAVLGHSTLGWSLMGTAEDQERLALVYATLWPGNDFAADAAEASGKGRARFRDAMHVATGIRNAFQAFVTAEPAMLRRAGDIREPFPNFRILSPREAVLECAARLRAVRIRYAAQEWTYALPSWPSEGEISAWAAER